MKILLMVSSMGTGGAERVAANLCNGWACRGYLVTLVVTYSNRGHCAYTLDPRITLVYLSDQVSLTGKKTPTKLSRLLALRGIINTLSPDVAISFLTNVNVAAILASLGLGIPLIVAERVHPPQHSLGWRLDLLRKLTYPFASRIVMLTDKSLQWAESNILFARAVVVPNPVHIPLARNDPIRPPDDFFATSTKVIVAAGRLVPQKQFDHLIRAFSAVAPKHPDWNVAIVGEGPLLSELQLLAESLGLASQIKFIGRAGNIGDWYSRADLFVLCSMFEGFPNTLAEAMAYGCAVVSYDCDTGPRDIVTNGADGILVPAGDEKALSTEIAGLMADDNRRTRMASAAESVAIRFALPQILAQWDVIFAEL